MIILLRFSVFNIIYQRDNYILIISFAKMEQNAEANDWIVKFKQLDSDGKGYIGPDVFWNFLSK